MLGYNVGARPLYFHLPVIRARTEGYAVTLKSAKNLATDGFGGYAVILYPKSHGLQNRLWRSDLALGGFDSHIPRDEARRPLPAGFVLHSEGGRVESRSRFDHMTG